MRSLVALCLATRRSSRSGDAAAEEPVLVPAIDGDWWQVAHSPDLGELALARAGAGRLRDLAGGRRHLAAPVVHPQDQGGRQGAAASIAGRARGSPIATGSRSASRCAPTPPSARPSAGCSRRSSCARGGAWQMFFGDFQSIGRAHERRRQDLRAPAAARHQRPLRRRAAGQHARPDGARHRRRLARLLHGVALHRHRAARRRDLRTAPRTTSTAGRSRRWSLSAARRVTTAARSSVPSS